MPTTKKQPPTPKALKPSEMADSTREQQEAHVLMNGRTCVGKLMRKPKDEAALWKEWHAIAASGKEKAAREFIKSLLASAQKLAAPRVTLSIPELPTEKGNWFRLRQIAFPLIRVSGSRVGFRCGWNQNVAVLAEEFDGKDHEVDCPNCGRPFLWTAPVFY